MALFLSPRDLTRRAQLYEQLSQLTAAGITITAALELVSRNPPAREFRKPLQAMVARLATGSTVADSMAQLGDWVPVFDIALVRAAEHSGRLDVVFRMLAGYYNDRAALARQTISDLLYPLFVFHFAMFLMPFVLWVMGKLTGLEYFLLSFGVLGAIWGAVIAIIYASQGKRGNEWRAIFEKICRPVPVLGSARQALALARLSAALEALLTAGVTVIEAWEMAAAACGSPSIVRTVQQWRPQLVGGQTPSEAVSNEPHQFPEVFANLYHSGEISGQLDETLLRLHKYYQDEGSRKMHLLSKWVPQVIYFCVVGVVVYFVFSFYLGYFNQIKQATDMGK
jgi:type II secretory pathway component PulF